jgi:hypothetical protein
VDAYSRIQTPVMGVRLGCFADEPAHRREGKVTPVHFRYLPSAMRSSLTTPRNVNVATSMHLPTSISTPNTLQ